MFSPTFETKKKKKKAAKLKASVTSQGEVRQLNPVYKYYQITFTFYSLPEVNRVTL